MIAINYSTLRDKMKTYLDKVTDDCESIIVTRKGENKNVVLLSEEKYNNLVENAYLLSNKSNYDWLMESKTQLEQGDFSSHELIEVPENE